jgi:CheY-like chemotaxis protein
MVQKQSTTEVLEVLFIEDDQHFAEIYKQRLELDGYRVTVASNQRQALRMLSSRVPDLIFLDVTLPDMNVWEVLSSLRNDVQTRCAPIIVLTPDGSEELLRSALALESHDHMLKIGREGGRKVLLGPWFGRQGFPREA